MSRNFLLLFCTLLLVAMGCGQGQSPKGNQGQAGTPAAKGVAPAVVVETSETKFEVGLKDVWYSDLPARLDEFEKGNPGGTIEKKRCLVVVYYYKNLGPREASFHFYKVEVQTEKDHLFGVHKAFSHGGAGGNTNLAGGWQPKQTKKIDDTGDGAVAFALPEGEVPKQLICVVTGVSESSKLNMKLSDGPFKVRLFDSDFGFLPANPDEAVAGLVKFLQQEKVKEAGFLGQYPALQSGIRALGNIGPAAKAAVPELTQLLAEHKLSIDFRVAVAKTLGKIGPGAKDALPALKQLFAELKKNVFGPFDDLGTKRVGEVESAIRQISPKEELPKEEVHKKFEESFELPKEGGTERKLELDVVVVTFGVMDHGKSDQPGGQHVFSGKGEQQPIFLVKNKGTNTVRIGVASVASELGDLRNNMIELKAGQEYRLKLYPESGNWTCYLYVQQIKKK